jgi:serine/threonine-protein kinase ATR
MERIAALLAKNIVKHPDIVVETMSLIGYTRKAFFTITLPFTIPALVMISDRQALESISSIVGSPLGYLLFDHAGLILSKLFLCDRVEGSFDFLINLLRELTGSEVTKDSVLTSCAVPFIVSMVVELGDEDKKVTETAVKALQRAHREFNKDKGQDADLGSFLKPHMLGIISQLNERLHDLQGKKSVEEKRKIIRSINQLIGRVGNTMASFSPQVSQPVISTRVNADDRSSRASRAHLGFPSSAVKPFRRGIYSSRHSNSKISVLSSVVLPERSWPIGLSSVEKRGKHR